MVKKILRGYQRVETDRIIAFRSHWGYRSEYCNPAKGNEKGGVEGELGWYRRNCLVPVPEAKDLATLNEQLLVACVANRDRMIHGKSMTVGDAFLGALATLRAGARSPAPEIPPARPVAECRQPPGIPATSDTRTSPARPRARVDQHWGIPVPIVDLCSRKRPFYGHFRGWIAITT
jgi:hypothetical protein